MRIAGRGALVGIVGLVFGLLLSFVVALFLRSATPNIEFLSQGAPTSSVAAWTFAAAHGVPVEVEAGAKINDERLQRLGNTIGDLLGESGGLKTTVNVGIRLAPLSILFFAGAAMALSMRMTGMSSVGDAVRGSLVVAGVYGAGLAVIAMTLGRWNWPSGRLFSVGANAKVSPVLTFAYGALAAAVFAAAGCLATRSVRAHVSVTVKAIAYALSRTVAAATVTTVGGLVVLGIAQSTKHGSFPRDPKITFVALLLFSANLIGAAMLLAFGATMHLAFAAGPLSQFHTLGYASTGGALSSMRWIFLLVPLLAGFVGGRSLRRVTTGESAERLAIWYATSWGIALAILAMLLRVNIGADVSVGPTEVGGFASINPLIAFITAFGWAAITSYMTMLRTRPPSVAERGSYSPPPLPQTCGSCGAVVPQGDTFCGVCGQAV